MGSRFSTLSSDPTTPSLPRSLASVLPTLGHGIGIWLTAGRSFLETARKSGDKRLLVGWEALGCPALPHVLPIQGVLKVSLRFDAAECQVMNVQWGELMTPAAWAFHCWLLHLPAHRIAWVRGVRESRFQVMRRVIPPCWLVSQDEPPPGTVISGLEIGSWAEVDAATARDPQLQWLSLGVNGARWLQRNLPSDGQVTASYDCASNGRVELAGVSV